MYSLRCPRLSVAILIYTVWKRSASSVSVARKKTYAHTTPSRLVLRTSSEDPDPLAQCSPDTYPPSGSPRHRDTASDEPLQLCPNAATATAKPRGRNTFPPSGANPGAARIPRSRRTHATGTAVAAPRTADPGERGGVRLRRLGVGRRRGRASGRRRAPRRTGRAVVVAARARPTRERPSAARSRWQRWPTALARFACFARARNPPRAPAPPRNPVYHILCRREYDAETVRDLIRRGRARRF